MAIEQYSIKDIPRRIIDPTDKDLKDKRPLIVSEIEVSIKEVSHD